jgi:hypothetical protein
MLTVNRLERFARGIVEGSLPPIEGVDNPQTGTDESVPCPSQFVLASRKHSVIERDSESSRERKEPDSTSTLRGEVGFLLSSGQPEESKFISCTPEGSTNTCPMEIIMLSPGTEPIPLAVSPSVSTTMFERNCV